MTTITFDQIIPIVKEVLHDHADSLKCLESIVVNRDLNGRIRLILAEDLLEKKQEAKAVVEIVANELSCRLGRHGFPAERMVLFEPSLEALEEVRQNAPHFPLEGFDENGLRATLVDRLVTEADWSSISGPDSSSKPRVVFFSVKGGVGRTTALTAAALSLAQDGMCVMVADLDLESPGLGHVLLPADKFPTYGIMDWLVEDLVDNGAHVLEDMASASPLCRDGDLLVVPAHGREPGEYVAKLERAWMPKAGDDGRLESWAKRLNRMLDDLERQRRPDVLLIDSRAGMDEIASACIAHLKADLVLLFAIDSEQTWSGYRILFSHWQRTGAARDIRERLQLVGAMLPEKDRASYDGSLLENAWSLFAEQLYDEVPAAKADLEDCADECFSYDKASEEAPHFPWPVSWHPGFVALQSARAHFLAMQEETRFAFNRFIEKLNSLQKLRKADEVEHHA